MIYVMFDQKNHLDCVAQAEIDLKQSGTRVSSAAPKLNTEALSRMPSFKALIQYPSLSLFDKAILVCRLQYQPLVRRGYGDINSCNAC